MIFGKNQPVPCNSVLRDNLRSRSSLRRMRGYLIFSMYILRTVSNSFAFNSPRRSFQIYSSRSLSSSNTMPNFWNREESTPRSFAPDKPIVKQARILSLSNSEDPANAALHKGNLPEGSKLLAIGTKIEEFDLESLKKEEPNAIFVSHPKVRKSTRFAPALHIVMFLYNSIFHPPPPDSQNYLLWIF